MSQRAELKEASLNRILMASAARLRTEGLSGAAIVAVMQEAGLTHGAFYSHFANKEELAVAGFRFALKDNRPRWIGRRRAESWLARLTRLAKRYLTTVHRDDRAKSCALAALASDAGRSSPAFKNAYEEELIKSLRAICDASDETEPIDPDRFDSAIAFMALCVGGLSLARAVESAEFSERILESCRRSVIKIASQNPTSTNAKEFTDEQ